MDMEDEMLDKDVAALTPGNEKKLGNTDSDDDQTVEP